MFTQTKEWADMQILFYEEIEKLSKTIPYKDKDLKHVGEQYVARQEAIDIIKRVLRRVESGDREATPKQSYK